MTKINIDDLPLEYCLYFKESKREIYYIGCDHTNDETSLTFQMIRKIVPKCDALVVEGFSGKINFDHLEPNDGEGFYALSIARKLGNIDMFGAETPINQTVSQIAKNYELDDLKGWTFLVLARQCYDVKYSEEQMWEMYVGYAGWFVSLIEQNGLDLKFNPLQWFQKRYGEKWSYGNYLDHSTPGPDFDVKDPVDKSSGIARQISQSIAKLREPNIMKNLLEVSEKYKTTCFIIGRDHIKWNYKILVKKYPEVQQITL